MNISRSLKVYRQGTTIYVFLLIATIYDLD